VKILRFIADNPNEALAQIHARLGPEAVVLSVRRVPVEGLARLWQRNGRVELLAGIPDPTPDHFHSVTQPTCADDNPFTEAAIALGRWQTVAWLEAMGLLPEHAVRLQSHLNAVHGESRPTSLDEEWAIVSAMLASFWTTAPRLEDGGAPGRMCLWVRRDRARRRCCASG